MLASGITQYDICGGNDTCGAPGLRAQGEAGRQAGLRCFRRGYLLTDEVFDDDGYEKVWHAATGLANQHAGARPCACPTRRLERSSLVSHKCKCKCALPAAASASQHMQVAPERRAALITADSHPKHACFVYPVQSTEAPTARTLNIAAPSPQHKHTHIHTRSAPCPSLTLLANALTRLLSGRRYACQLPGSPIHNPTRSNPPPTKRVIASTPQ